MNDESLRQGSAKQLRLKTTPFFSREKEELPQAASVHMNDHVHCAPNERKKRTEKKERRITHVQCTCTCTLYVGVLKTGVTRAACCAWR